MYTLLEISKRFSLHCRPFTRQRFTAPSDADLNERRMRAQRAARRADGKMAPEDMRNESGEEKKKENIEKR